MTCALPTIGTSKFSSLLSIRGKDWTTRQTHKHTQTMFFKILFYSNQLHRERSLYIKVGFYSIIKWGEKKNKIHDTFTIKGKRGPCAHRWCR